VPSRQIAYCNQAGIPEWKDNITYETGSIVSDGLGSIYRSLVDTNLDEPFTDATKWFMVDSIKITDIGDSYTALNTDFLIRFSLSDPASYLTLRVPDPAPHLIGRRYIFKSVSVTTWNLSLFTASSLNGKFNGNFNGLLLGKIGDLYESYLEVICDGQYWWSLNWTADVITDPES
jgi:hypothetical protein